MSKTQDEFLDHFARLGVFSKVQALIEPENENEIAKSTTNATITSSSATDEQSTAVGGNAATATTGASGQQSQVTGKYY